MSSRLQELGAEIYDNDLILDLVVGHVGSKLALKRLMVASKRCLTKVAKVLYKEVGKDILAVISRKGCDYYRLLLYLQSIRAVDSGSVGWPTDIDIPSYRRRFPSLQRIDFILIGSSSKSSIYLYDEPLLEPRSKRDGVAEADGTEMTSIVGKLFLAVESEIVRLALDNVGIHGPDRRFHLIGLRLGVPLEKIISETHAKMPNPMVMLRAEDHSSCDSSVCNSQLWTQLFCKLEYLSITNGCPYLKVRQLLEYCPRLKTFKACVDECADRLELAQAVASGDDDESAREGVDNAQAESVGSAESAETDEDWSEAELESLWDILFSPATGSLEEELDEDESHAELTGSTAGDSDDETTGNLHYCKTKRAYIDRKALIPADTLARRSEEQAGKPKLHRMLGTCAFGGLEYFAMRCGYIVLSDWVPDIRLKDLLPTVRHLTLGWNPKKASYSYISRFPDLDAWLGRLLSLELPRCVESIHLGMKSNPEQHNPFHVGMALSVMLPAHVKIILKAEGSQYTAQYSTWAKHVSQARLHGIQLAHSLKTPGYRLVETPVTSAGQAATINATTAPVTKADRMWNALTEGGKIDTLIRAGLIAPGYYQRAALEQEGAESKESRGYKTPDVLFKEMNEAARNGST